MPNGEIQIHASSLVEAKLALKELKIKKKELSLAKRELTARQREIRAAYTDKVRHRGSMARGGGGFGKFVRLVQTVSRDGARSNLASALAPFEQQKQSIEYMINRLDYVAIQLEQTIAQNS